MGGLHPYRYAHNGPTWDADPLGLWPSGSAPIAASLLILAAGVVGGATFGFLNEGLNNGFGCPSRLLNSTLKDAVVGGLAAVPFVFAGPGLAAMAAAGLTGEAVLVPAISGATLGTAAAGATGATTIMMSGGGGGGESGSGRSSSEDGGEPSRTNSSESESEAGRRGVTDEEYE